MPGLRRCTTGVPFPKSQSYVVPDAGAVVLVKDTASGEQPELGLAVQPAVSPFAENAESDNRNTNKV